MKQLSSQYKYLHFINFKNITKWYVSYYLNPYSITSTFPLVKLKELINPVQDKIRLKEFDGKTRVVKKISFADGKIHLRDENKTRMDLYKLYNSDLLVSKINFHQGAIAINNIGDLVCTTHYQPYSIDNTKLLPAYLVFVLRSKTFLNFIDYLRAEGIKNEATYEFIGNLEIPLPPLNKQIDLVSNYHNQIQSASQKLQEIAGIESQIEKYFLEQLGVLKSDSKNKIKGLQIIQFSKIDRWDVWVNRGFNNVGIFKPIPFREIVIGKPVYGANVKGINKKSDVRYIRITDINENGSLNDEFVSPAFVEDKYLLKENDFLIARSGNTVGKTFLYKEKYGKAIYAGYLVKYDIDYSKVIPEYLLEYTKSFTFKNWVISNQRVAGQPNINGQEYLQAPFIIPPIFKQKEIVNYIQNQRNSIKQLQAQATHINSQAVRYFEQSVFDL